MFGLWLVRTWPEIMKNKKNKKFSSSQARGAGGGWAQGSQAFKLSSVQAG